MPSATEDQPPITIGQKEEAPPGSEIDVSARARTTGFLKEYPLRTLVLSVLVLTPCFWHQHIEAGDLASHTYNAWLAQLIKNGQAPGLWLASQWSNVLFDVTLSSLGNLVGLRIAEKLTVAAAVLVFFWGAFALVAAATRRIPWFVLPCLAIFTYGWTFEMGFLNYYISLGLAFFGLAIIWRGRGWERALPLALFPLTWAAHPLGAMLLFTMGTYISAARVLKPRAQALWLGGAGAVLLGIRFYLASHYAIRWLPGFKYTYNGADQLLLYGPWYQVPQILLLGFCVACVLNDVISRRDAPGLLAAYSLPLQLYGLSLLAARMLPNGILLPQYNAPLSLLTERLTSICAVLICCLLGAMKPRKWHAVGFAAVAAVFFVLLYQDTGKINRMENGVERYVSTLSPGQRVTATIWPFRGSRVFIHHIVARACIGHCFDFGDYEPATQQFRVRALPDNSMVTADFRASDAIMTGHYVVQPRDLPMVEIYQCDVSMTRLCSRKLSAGETNGKYGLHPLAP